MLGNVVFGGDIKRTFDAMVARACAGGVESSAGIILCGSVGDLWAPAT